MNLLFLEMGTGLMNPVADNLSPFAGQPGNYGGGLDEIVKGTPTIYTSAAGSTAVRIVASNIARRSLYLCNAHATQDAYFGFTSTVSTSTGFYLPAKTLFPFALDRFTGELWVVSSGAGDIRAIEFLSVTA